MNTLADFRDKLNVLSTTTISNVNQLNYEVLKSEVDLIKNELEKKISLLNVGNRTTQRLIKCPLNTGHFEWAMKNEKLLEGNTEWLNYWVSNLKLCQDTADILSVYFLRYCRSLYLNSSSTFYTPISMQKTLNLFNVTCLNLGIVRNRY